ncbi:hypothetical protein [uncultured Ruthenibacterium sp.]|uniref:hypothetical protein n=1 Tax=uncultured Ruthenibacterium sp. TaxID=1905347 RepID=UPI00349EAC0A
MELVLKIVGGIFAALGAVFGFLGLFLLYKLSFTPMLVFCALGGIFLAVGIGLLVAQSQIRRRRARLLDEGQRILADIVEVGYDTRVCVNGRYPLVIRCQAVNPADGCVYVFQSQAFWFDPAPFLGDRTQLPVYVDPDNYRHYAVDTEGIVPAKG